MVGLPLGCAYNFYPRNTIPSRPESEAMTLLTANVEYSGKQCLPGSIEPSAMAHT
jgi:hypothetical protein